MKILDRYIIKKLLLSFVFILCIIMLVITFIDLTEKNATFIKYKIPFKEIIHYYITFLPFIINLITPIIVFITTVFVTSKLAQHTEIIAILSAGINFWRLIVPYFVFALIISLFSFILIGWVLPNASKHRVVFEKKYFSSSEDHPLNELHIKIAQDVYLYVENYNPTYQEGSNVTLETIQGNLLIEKLSAKYMKWLPDKNKWELKDWVSRKIDRLHEYVDMGYAVDTTLNIVPKDFESQYKLQETLTLPELSTYIQNLCQKGADNVYLFIIERYIRYMSPCVAIILTFLGLLISFRKARGGMGINISMGFILAFVYIALFLLSKTNAEAGSNYPLLIVWTPNIIFAVLGMVLYRFTPK